LRGALKKDNPVKLAICPAGSARRGAQRVAAPAPGLNWLQFGTDMVVYGDGAPWDAWRADAARASAPIREVPAELPRPRLHLVVQKGRLFQKEHPDVPVLLDRGRYLLVDLDGERGRGLKPPAALLHGRARGGQSRRFRCAASRR
jgi:hypothetical protein